MAEFLYRCPTCGFVLSIDIPDASPTCFHLADDPPPYQRMPEEHPGQMKRLYTAPAVHVPHAV